MNDNQNGSGPHDVAQVPPGVAALVADAVNYETGKWYLAVTDECVICCIGWDDNDPRKTLKSLIDWNVKMALDPLVSGDAQALLQRGRDEEAEVWKAASEISLRLIEGLKADKAFLHQRRGQLVIERDGVSLQLKAVMNDNATLVARISELHTQLGEAKSCEDVLLQSRHELILERDALQRAVDTDYEQLYREQLEKNKDADRYRKLRAMHWSDKGLCVTMADSVKLGHDCPSLDRLDEAIDAAASVEDCPVCGGMPKANVHPCICEQKGK